MPNPPRVERVFQALQKKQPDRIPTLEWEIDEQLINQVAPGGDMYDFVDWADLDGITIFADSQKKYLDETTYIDEWGVTMRRMVEYYPVPIDYPIRNPEDLKDLKIPDPCSDWHFETLVEAVNRCKGKRAIIFRAQDGFSIPRNLRGFENILADFILNPGLWHDLVEISIEYNTQLAQKAISLGADVIFSSDDYADNRGPMMSPRHFREFVLPGLAALANAVHQSGSYLIKHTDGKIWPILDDILSTGVDCIDPLDPLGGMSVREVKAKYGTRVCIKGNVNIAGALSYGTVEEVQAEAAECIQAGKPGGAYIFSTSNSLMSCVNPRNYRAMLDTLASMGAYEPAG